MSYPVGPFCRLQERGEPDHKWLEDDSDSFPSDKFWINAIRRIRIIDKEINDCVEKLDKNDEEN